MVKKISKIIFISIMLTVMIFSIYGCSYSASYYYNKGVEATEKKEYDNAIENFVKVSENSKEDDTTDLSLKMRALYMLGDLYTDKGDINKAQEYYLQAYTLDIGDKLKNADRTATDLLRRALYLMSQSEYQKALDAINEALKKDQIDCKQELLFNQVVCYENLSDWTMAKAKMVEYVQAYPGDDRAKTENEFLQTR